MNKDWYIVSYNSEISKSICQQSGLDYIKVLNNKSIKRDEEDNLKFSDVSISTSAAITSYARIYINKIKLWILKNGGEIYYSDTDSIVSNIPLPDEFVGSELGKFKLEYKIKKGYFITSKTYLIEEENGNIIKKAKGVLSNDLTYLDYVNMYYNQTNATAIKLSTDLSFARGTVNINTKNVGRTPLNYNSYSKREKIYKNDIWVDTRPIKYSNNKISHIH